MNERRNHWPIALVFTITFFAVIICPCCKKKPSEQADTKHARSELQQPKPVEERTNEFPKKDTELSVEPKIGLKNIIAAASTWGTSFESWFGKSAPDFTLTDINGKQHKLSDYRSKNVMLIFWATWCGPCRLEIPHLIELRNTIGQDKLTMLAISLIDPRNTTEIVKGFLEQNKDINYTVCSVSSGDMPAPYNLVNSIPCSFFIDPEGKIKLATIGLLPLSDMKAIIQVK